MCSDRFCKGAEWINLHRHHELFTPGPKKWKTATPRTQALEVEMTWLFRIRVSPLNSSLKSWRRATDRARYKNTKTQSHPTAYLAHCTAMGNDQSRTKAGGGEKRPGRSTTMSSCKLTRRRRPMRSRRVRALRCHSCWVVADFAEVIPKAGGAYSYCDNDHERYHDSAVARPY